MNRKFSIIQTVLSVWIAFVFVQSLFYKFTGSPETVYIFGTLDSWAAGLGFPGVFAPGGIFSAYVIGSCELFVSVLVLLSLIPSLRILRPIAGLGAMAVMTGAIFFHLFTPLGVSVLNTDGTRDGGLLFGMACSVWLGGAYLVFSNRSLILDRLFGGQRNAVSQH